MHISMLCDSEFLRLSRALPPNDYFINGGDYTVRLRSNYMRIQVQYTMEHDYIFVSIDQRWYDFMKITSDNGLHIRQQAVANIL